MPSTRRIHYLHLAVALLAVAVSGPAIRFVAAPALVVVAWRLILAWPVVAAVALVRRQPWPLAWGGVAGAVLALHWLAWIAAVQTTTLASAALLVSTGSLWAAVLSRPLLGERVPSRQWFGLAVALAGVALLVTSKTSGRHTVSGDLLALAGAFAWVAYTFMGRRARQDAGFWGYTATLYLSAGLCAVAAALLLGCPLSGLSSTSWFALAVLALLPTLLGHGSINYLLRYIGPARLSLYTLVEPLLAALAAWPLFGEVPSLQQAAGGLLTLAGVGLGGINKTKP